MVWADDDVVEEQIKKVASESDESVEEREVLWASSEWLISMDRAGWLGEGRRVGWT